MVTKTVLSLDDLDNTKQCETPVKFRYVNADGEDTGIDLLLWGSESEHVKSGTRVLLNASRKKAAQQQVSARLGGRKPDAAFTPVEEDIEFGHRLTALRVAGWEGIKEDYSEERALRLVANNRHIADFVTETTNELGNFTKAPSKT